MYFFKGAHITVTMLTLHYYNYGKYIVRVSVYY